MRLLFFLFLLYLPVGVSDLYRLIVLGYLHQPVIVPHYTIIGTCALEQTLDYSLPLLLLFEVGEERFEGLFEFLLDKESISLVVLTELFEGSLGVEFVETRESFEVRLELLLGEAGVLGLLGLLGLEVILVVVIVICLELRFWFGFWLGFRFGFIFGFLFGFGFRLLL